LSYSFRETFVYQSTMVTAAGLVAAEVDGKPWAEVIRTRVLQPLRMNATYLDTTSAEKGRRASGVP
jgi:CubicO group peptidase (beta-lactamase class C family)